MFFILNLQSSDSEDDFEDESDKFKSTTVDTKDDASFLGISSQGSDSQQNNCDMHFRLKTLSPTPSCVIS